MMTMNSTEAWVIHRGPDKFAKHVPGELRREEYQFSELSPDEVLVEPIYGCWEGNMTHALERRPVDICRQRNEDRLILGNTGVVRALKAGPAVHGVREGDPCIVFGTAETDQRGYPVRILAYDAPGTMGVLAKRVKLSARSLLPVPQHTRYSLRHWAAFSGRYVTAWSNWKVAYGCWRVQMSEEDLPGPSIWGWGGGSAFAELSLAQHHGWRASMIAGRDERLRLIKSHGMDAVDRRWFGDLSFDEVRYASDRDYQQEYQAAEERFLALVREGTGGEGVAIFVDHLGAPVTRATLRALGRQGVLTTAGWKCGMRTSSVRALECINRHIHVHTHYSRYSEGRAAIEAGERMGWMPPLADDERVYQWDEIPTLARDYAAGTIDSYFPLFQVNSL